jgi:hypothetical protein
MECGMLPGEKIIFQSLSIISKKDGTLKITQLRLVWQKLDDQFNTVSELLENLLKVEDVIDGKRALLRLTFKERGKPIIISWNGDEAVKMMKQAKKTLDNPPNEDGLEADCMIKMKTLHDSLYLM